MNELPYPPTNVPSSMLWEHYHIKNHTLARIAADFQLPEAQIDGMIKAEAISRQAEERAAGEAGRERAIADFRARKKRETGRGYY